MYHRLSDVNDLNLLPSDNTVALVDFKKNIERICGNCRIEPAKMIGITPACAIRNGI